MGKLEKPQQLQQKDLPFEEGFRSETKEERRLRLIRSINLKRAKQIETGSPANFTDEEKALIETERRDLDGDSQPEYRQAK